MITIEKGMTNSVWISVKDALPAGYTQSTYKFTFTEPLSNTQKVFYPSAVETGYKWTKFLIAEGKPENLLGPKLDLAAGLWHYTITDTISNTILHRGLVNVVETKTLTPSIVTGKQIGRAHV